MNCRSYGSTEFKIALLVGAFFCSSYAAYAQTTLQTPAEHAYGAPHNPQVGKPVDINITGPLTLDRAIQIALQRQNTIALSRARVDIGRQQVVSARARYFPQITPSYQYQNVLSPFSSSSSLGVTGTRTINSESQSSGIIARQLIWDNGLRESNLQSARNSLTADQFGLGDVRETVILNVEQSYYTLLHDKELVAVEKTNVQLSQTTLNSIQAQVQVGNAAQSDVLQAQSNLANANVTLLQAESNVYNDEASLKNAMGVVSSLPLKLADQQPPPPNEKPDPRALDSYVQTAYLHRLDLKQQQSLVNAQTDVLRTARIQAGLSVNASVSEGYDLQPTSGESRNFIVSLSYPLFDGGASRANVRSNEAALEEQQRTLDQLEQNIRLEVEQDYRTREVARQQIVSAQAAVNAGITNENAAKAELENGLINIVDSITAQLQLVTAKQQYVDSIFTYYIANARLIRDIGQNDPGWTPRLPRLKSSPGVPTK